MTAHAYDRLDPDRILGAVESAGYTCDGHLLALNSYENRVYQVGIDGEAPLVAKFYRPGRWDDATIQEEHDFGRELAEAEIPVVAPLPDVGGRTLLEHERFRFALFPRRGGRAPELDNPGHLEQLGRFLGRLHAVGAAGEFTSRPELTVDTYGAGAPDYLIKYSVHNHDLLKMLQTLRIFSASPQFFSD